MEQWWLDWLVPREQNTPKIWVTLALKTLAYRRIYKEKFSRTGNEL
jgi:hypothetical protein